MVRKHSLGTRRRLILGAMSVGISCGCALRPTVFDQRELNARILDSSPTKSPSGDVASKPDPHVERTSGAAGDAEKLRPEEAATGAEPLTLDAARAITLRRNPVLSQARAAVDSAQGNLVIANSGFMPTIQGTTAFQAFDSKVGYVGTGYRFPVLPVRGFGPGVQDFTVTEAQMKWTIFQFGKQLSKHGQAAMKKEVAALELERTAQTVVYETTAAYFDVLATEAAVEIAERAMERAASFQKESADLLRRGVITQEEHLRSEGRLAEMKQLLTDAKSEAEVAVSALNKAMGIYVNTPTRVAKRQEAPSVALSLHDALGLAVSSRREIPAVRRAIDIAQEDMKIARADYLPSISIQAGYSNVTGNGVQNSNVGAGGIFVTQELFGGGRRNGQVIAAEAGIRSAIAQAQQVCDGIAYEVNVAYRGLEDAKERIAASKAVLDQARENLRLVSNRYKAGDATPAELVEARASDTKSEQTYTSSYYLYQKALARLEFAVGTELPLVAGGHPEASSTGAGPANPPGPPGTASPFRPRESSGALPGLPPPPDLGNPATPSTRPLPGTRTPSPTDNPGLFGPPSLSRPPYESTSPFGTPRP